MASRYSSASSTSSTTAKQDGDAPAQDYGFDITVAHGGVNFLGLSIIKGGDANDGFHENLISFQR